MCRLIWVFASRTILIVGFVLRWLNRFVVHILASIEVEVAERSKFQTIPLNYIKPGHSISYKISSATSEYPDQLVHYRRLIRVFAVYFRTVWVSGYPESARRRLWLDCANAQTDLCVCVCVCVCVCFVCLFCLFVCWAHIQRSRKCSAPAQFICIYTVYTPFIRDYKSCSNWTSFIQRWLMETIT